MKGIQSRVINLAKYLVDQTWTEIIFPSAQLTFVYPASQPGFNSKNKITYERFKVEQLRTKMAAIS